MSKGTRRKGIDSTRFTCHAPDAKAVFLAGTFNGWNPQTTSMVKGTNGDWSVAVDLTPGRYEYNTSSTAHGAASRTAMTETFSAPNASSMDTGQ